MTCQRCRGLLSVGYDELERCEFLRCLNCGARPAQVVRPAPVSPRVARVVPGLCLICQVRPPREVRTVRGALHHRQPKRCAECAARRRPRTREVAA